MTTLISCEKLLAAFVHIWPKLKTIYQYKTKSFISLWAALKKCLQLEVYFSRGSAVQYPLKNITPADPLKLIPSNSNNNNNNNNSNNNNNNNNV